MNKIEIISDSNEILRKNKIRKLESRFIDSTLKDKFKYRYEIKISDYNCTLVNFQSYTKIYPWTTKGRATLFNFLFPKRYMICDNVLIYQYNINCPLVKNIVIEPFEENFTNHNISTKLKENLLELQKSRLFEVKVDNQKIIIKKHLHTTNKFATISRNQNVENIDDIKEFYDKIIKEMC